MPLPFADFPASAATFDLTTGSISYEAAGELAASGTVAGEIIEGAGIAAAAAALAEPALIAGVGLAGLAAADAVIKHYAPTRTVPNFTQLFSGGQNNGSTYKVVVGVTFHGGSPQTFETFKAGAVRGIQVSSSGDNQFRYDLLSGGTPFLIATGANEDFDQKPFIISVDRISGAPESSTQPAIQPSPFGTLTIPSPTETTIPQPNGDPVKITFVPYPSQSVTTTQQPGQRDQPGVLIAVPEAGMLINFGPTGVTIRFREPFASTQVSPRLSPLLPPVPRPPAECDCPTESDPELLCRVKRLQSDLLNNGFTYTVTNGGTGQGKKIDSIADTLVDVSLSITSYATSERTQRPAPGTPIVFFIGWFAWSKNGNPGERVPISYLQTTWVAPDGVDGFTYSLHDGASANMAYTTKVKKQYVDNC